jgi:hypothetical protein
MHNQREFRNLESLFNTDLFFLFSDNKDDKVNLPLTKSSKYLQKKLKNNIMVQN